MAALSITASQVIPGSDAVLETGIAGGTITQGMSVVFNTTTSKWVAADANDTAVNVFLKVGIAVSAASASQYVTVQTGGTITIGAGAAPTVGVVYGVGATTAGDIAPSSDFTTGWTISILGVGVATNSFKMLAWSSGVTK